MSLAQKALGGFFWTGINSFGNQGIQFLVLIVLARLLMPEDFGLVAMVMVFFSLSQNLITSGFAQALIREKKISEEDKATTFFLNLFLAVIMFVVLWFSAPAIARFFDQEKLIELIRFMGSTLFFFSITIVQRAMFTQALRFKSMMYIEVSSSVLTGFVAVVLAIKGYGVWALAVKFVAISFFNSILFYFSNPWLPKTFMHKASFIKLFGFGSKLMVSGLLDTAFTNLYNIVIAKFFTAATLGFYAQAITFRDIFSKHLISTIQKVTYPILSKTNDDPERLKLGYRKIILVTSFFIFPAMLGLGLVAEPLILFTVGERWLETVPMLQLICLSGMLYHLHSINLNILQVVGRTDLFLKLEIIKKVKTIIIVAISLNYGIWGLLIGSVISSYTSLFINMYYTTTFLNYSIKQQFRDLAPIIASCVPMIVVVFGIQQTITSYPVVELFLMVSAGAVVYLGTTILFKSAPLEHVVDLLKPRISFLQRFVELRFKV
jgi:O-antigen/teichoic acid export membrane protein